MDGFTYYNLFDTKGTEYLIIIAFLLLIIPFWILINKPIKIKGMFKNTLGVLTAGILKVPQGIFYNGNHTWAYLEKAGTAKVGLDDLLLHMTGNINLHPLKEHGYTVRKGEIISEVVQDGKKLNITSPVSGKIMAINPLLEDDPGLLNEDPYGKGWIFLIKPSDWVAETSSCYFAGEASEWLQKELERFKDFIALSAREHSQGSSTVYLQDGGELADNALAQMPDEVWKEFQDSFLRQQI